MPLEQSFGPQNTIDIKNLTIEQLQIPNKELISESDWQEIYASLETDITTSLRIGDQIGVLNEQHLLAATWLAANITLLKPKEPNLHVPEQIFDQGLSLLKDRREGEYWFEQWYRFIDLAFELKVLFPGRVQELNLDDELYQKITEEFVKNLNNADDYSAHQQKKIQSVAYFWRIGHLVKTPVYLKVLFPSKQGEVDNLLPEVERLTQGYIDEGYTKIIEGQSSEQQKKHFADIIALEKILNFKSHARLLTDKNLQATLKTTLNGLSQKRKWYELVGMAKNIKILEADEVRIANGRLEIYSPDDRQNFQKEAPPEQRNF